MCDVQCISIWRAVLDPPVLALQVKCTVPTVWEGLFCVTEATSLLVSGGCLLPAWEYFIGRVISYYLGTPGPAQGVPAPRSLHAHDNMGKRVEQVHYRWEP